MQNSFTEEFIAESASRINENLPRIKKCFDILHEEEIWEKMNPSSNCVGNLILHLCGNITQYIISGLGGEEDNRKRDAEFSTGRVYNKVQLWRLLNETVNSANKIIMAMDDESILRKRTVQGFELSGIGIIIHVVEHFSYHMGQIAYFTKLRWDTQLNFYEGVDLNKKNG